MTDTTTLTDTLLHAPPGARVAIAMSGGVDSSVAAALLVEQGYDVVGVHMKLYDVPDEHKRARSCCSLDDTLDARQVCARLGIPFYVVDVQEDFGRNVIDYFVGSYRTGQTPNPCVMCNRTIKHDLLLSHVREFGCDYLATGHYARLRRNADSGAFELCRPRDRRKDQTYFLWGTRREELPYLLYPLAEHVKDETREMAGANDFITHDKPDSQEVCFVGRDYRDFLRPRLADAPPEPGDIVDTVGRVLGRHLGLQFYTIGQRRGLGIQVGGGPYYVVALDAERNRVVVGPDEALHGRALAVSGINWVSRAPATHPLRAVVKVRYAHEGTPATITPDAQGGARVDFEAPVRAITPGQAAVFYDGDVLLGGGWIEHRLDE